MPQKLTTEDFIVRSVAIHGDKYDYTLVRYVNCKTKVRILCPTHGKFWQVPEKHWSGSGCNQCGNENMAEVLTLSTDQFIQNAVNLHGDRYDYSNVDYVNSKSKVCIICPIHGEFWQTPNNHISKLCNCPICVNDDKSIQSRSNKQEFIQKTTAVHGDRYDYSKVDYVNAHTNITIICEKHGEFSSRPQNHLAGRGCPICNSSKGETMVRIFLMERDVYFTQQYRFKDCRDKNPLPFDFYIRELNLCIEYDGIQHFKPIKFFGGIKGLRRRQRHDKIKTAYCKSQGIRLIRIRYDESIDKKLEKLRKNYE